MDSIDIHQGMRGRNALPTASSGMNFHLSIFLPRPVLHSEEARKARIDYSSHETVTWALHLAL